MISLLVPARTGSAVASAFAVEPADALLAGWALARSAAASLPFRFDVPSLSPFLTVSPSVSETAFGGGGGAGAASPSLGGGGGAAGFCASSLAAAAAADCAWPLELDSTSADIWSDSFMSPIWVISFWAEITPSLNSIVGGCGLTAARPMPGRMIFESSGKTRIRSTSSAMIFTSCRLNANFRCAALATSMMRRDPGGGRSTTMTSPCGAGVTAPVVSTGGLSDFGSAWAIVRYRSWTSVDRDTPDVSDELRPGTPHGAQDSAFRRLRNIN